MAQSLQCNLHINDSLISTLFIMNSVDICTLKYNVILFTHMHILTLWRPLLPLIVGGGGLGGLNPPPQFMSRDAYFVWKSALNFSPWAKFQTFWQLTPSSSFRSIPTLLPHAVKHPVLYRVKPSFVIFDIGALWQLNPVCHRMLRSCTQLSIRQQWASKS